MSIKRVLKWTGIVLVCLVALVLLYLTFSDLAWVEGKVEAAVAEATGRTFDIETFELDALWSPYLRVEGVSLANAEWGSEPKMIEVGHFSARIDLWSVISRPIHVEEVRLLDVRVLMETNEAGDSNLSMEGAAEPEEVEEPAEPRVVSPEAEVPLVIEFAEIRNIELVMREPGAEDRVVTVEALGIAANEEYHLELGGNGMLNEHSWELNGAVGPLGAVKRGDDIQVGLTGSLGNLELGIDGHIATLREVRGTDLMIHVGSEDVVPLLETLGVSLDVTGALVVDGELKALGDESTLEAKVAIGEIEANVTAQMSPGEISFESSLTDLSLIGAAVGQEGLPAYPLSLSGAVSLSKEAIELKDVTTQIDSVEATVSGTISKVPEVATEIDIDVGGPELSDVSPLLPDIPFELTAAVRQTPDTLTLKPFELTLDESRVSGSLEIQQGEAQSITADLRSERLDLSPFLADFSATEEVGDDEIAELTEIPEEELDDPTTEWVFTEDPLPFDSLMGDRVDVRLDIDELVVGAGLSYEGIEGTMTLGDGTLDTEFRVQTPMGGRIEADLELHASEEQADLTIDLVVEDIHPNLLSGDLEDLSQVPSVDLTVDIESRGNSARALAESANGKILLSMGEGLIANNALAFFSGDLLTQLFSALNPFAKEEPYTKNDCVILGMDIEAGKAPLTAMYVQGEKVTIIGEGDIDLNTEKISLHFNTKPRTGLGISADMFVTPFVELVGTLASPRVGISKKGALLSGGAAVATGGLSLLVQGAADRLSGGADRCEEVLAEAGGHGLLED